MDKEQKELELKKIEIEKLKIKEGLFRTLVLIVLTVGAGLGAVIYKTKLGLIKQYQVIIDTVFIIVLTISLIFIVIITFYIWTTIRKKLKEL